MSSSQLIVLNFFNKDPPLFYRVVKHDRLDLMYRFGTSDVKDDSPFQGVIPFWECAMKTIPLKQGRGALI